MSGKKHVFKMVPGKEALNKSGFRILQGSVDGEALTWYKLNKIWFIPLDDEDNIALDLPIKFCDSLGDNPFLSVQCIKENGKDLEYNHYNCDKREGLITKCQLPFIPPRNVNIDYANDSHSFAYLNDKLMKISIDYKLSKSSEHGKHYEHILKAQPVEYQYVTLEE